MKASAHRCPTEFRLCKRRKYECKVSVRAHSRGGDYIHPAPAASGRTGTLQDNLRLNSCRGGSAKEDPAVAEKYLHRNTAGLLAKWEAN